jgi:hypothetical protein
MPPPLSLFFAFAIDAFRHYSRLLMRSDLRQATLPRPPPLPPIMPPRTAAAATLPAASLFSRFHFLRRLPMLITADAAISPPLIAFRYFDDYCRRIDACRFSLIRRFSAAFAAFVSATIAAFRHDFRFSLMPPPLPALIFACHAI